MGGFFTYEEFWEIYKILYRQFSDLISEPTKIGHTTLNEPIYTFKIGKDIDNPKRTAKSSILFTSLHHSREPITLSMLVAILIQYVRILQHPAKNSTLFSQIDIEFIPVINIDSYKLINKSYGTSSWSKTKTLRKNRQPTPSCSFYRTGTDLNRNYSYKFDYGAPSRSTGGSNNPCAQDYRGPHPFSAPETQALKSFIENSPQITSALNFHAYGDLWIYPYSFSPSTSNPT